MEPITWNNYAPTMNLDHLPITFIKLWDDVYNKLVDPILLITETFY